ncbi:MAG: hypothetical protein IH859_04780 [Chloroflexi bacterium]|nr:hypothetical protein [Chloroflexota bacterium]
MQTSSQHIEQIVTSRLNSIKKIVDLDAGMVSGLSEFIIAAKDEELFRMSPYWYADKVGIEPQKVIDLFLYATHAGIFEFNWGVLCPSCGAFLSTKSGLRWLKSGEHCSLCALPFQSNLDEEIEVAFTISPTVRTIRFHDLENLDFEKDGMFVFFSSSIALFPEVHKVVHGSFHSSFQVESGESTEIELDLADDHYVLMAPVTHSTGHIPVSAENEGHIAEFELLLDGQITPETIPLAHGHAKIVVNNRTKEKVVVGLLKDARIAPFDNETREYPIQPLYSIKPFLTGKKLISNQVFRDLFHAESIPAGSGLEFKSLTFLFTDLKGSTEMYDRIGDFQAFSLVNTHFGLLRGIIAAGGGSVVKTMGDAIMATFAEPLSAVNAAQLMLREITKMGLGEDLVLKIGIHSGPTLAVAANNQLDYFGQTVNISNRVQSVANPSEIVITEAVYSSPDVKGFFEAEKRILAPEKMDLKGVSDEIYLYRMN